MEGATSRGRHGPCVGPHLVRPKQAQVGTSTPRKGCNADQEWALEDLLTGPRIRVVPSKDSGEIVTGRVVNRVEDATVESSSVTESFSDSSETGSALLEAPHYTRPPEFEGNVVPEVLLSGNHKAIEEWRLSQAKAKTRRVRPDLLVNDSPEKKELTDD